MWNTGSLKSMAGSFPTTLRRIRAARYTSGVIQYFISLILNFGKMLQGSVEVL